ncbi:MAG: DNA repair protein RadC [Clostridia bacterium]
MAKNIVDLPINDRPYEKLELVGASNLTNSELLAIVIKNGTKKLNCLEIAQNILKGNENNSKVSDLEYLTSLSIEELKTYEGIGRVKAIQILSIVELSKRMLNIYVKSKDKIVSPRDVFNILLSEYLGKKQECLKTILLNKQNKIIAIITNAIGSNDSINIGLKEIFSEPIKQMAHGIILAHNHPSGSLRPSKQDIEFTKYVDEYSKIFNIELMDHIIIAGSEYLSLKEQKYI